MCPICRRRLLLGMGLVVLFEVAVFALSFWRPMRPAPTPGVSFENFRRLRVGMSGSNVERLLGKPQDVFQVSAEATECFWRTQSVVIELIIDPDGLRTGQAVDFVTDHAVEGVRTDESFLDRIRRLLHL